LPILLGVYLIKYDNPGFCTHLETTSNNVFRILKLNVQIKTGKQILLMPINAALKLYVQ